jgi:integrase
VPKQHIRLVSPATVNRTVGSRRLPNRDLRTRKYLTEAEVERLVKAVKDNRYGHRDATMILVAYRHGLRASEVVDLRWHQIEFRTANLHVRRVKQGTPSTHPILGDELRALRRLQREQEPKSPFVFTSERGAPFSPAGFARMIERAGIETKLSFKAHPHMLRHACGYKLANDGHDTLNGSPCPKDSGRWWQSTSTFAHRSYRTFAAALFWNFDAKAMVSGLTFGERPPKRMMNLHERLNVFTATC